MSTIQQTNVIDVLIIGTDNATKQQKIILGDDDECGIYYGGGGLNIKNTDTANDIIFTLGNTDATTLFDIKNSDNASKFNVDGTGKVTITGDLSVTGDLTTNSLINNTTITDKIIELANGTSGTPSGDSGIVIERGDSDNAFMGWDESADTFVLGTGSFTGISTGDLTITPTNLSVGVLTSSAITATDTTAPLILKYDAEEYVTHSVSNLGVYSITTTDASSDSGAITLDTVDSITLDSDTDVEGIVYADGGTNLLRIFNSSSDVIFKPLVDTKDIQFQQYDGNLLLDINDGGWVGIHNSAAGPGELRIYEDSDLGTLYTGFKAGNITTSITYTMPLADGGADQVLTTNGSGTLSWATASSNIDELTDGKSGGANFTNSIILGHQTTGTLNAAERNTAVGIASMDAIISGDDNVCVGHDAGGAINSGSQNTCIGSSAGDALTTGSNNTIIGYNAASSAVGATNEITLGNGNIDTIRSGATTIASLSDRRDKTNIENSNYGLNFIEKLRPVEFTWKRRIINKSDENNGHDGKNRVGFIAQELQEAMPNNENEILDLVYESNPERLEVKQGNLVPILVKAIQELHAQVKKLQTAYDAIKN